MCLCLVFVSTGQTQGQEGVKVQSSPVTVTVGNMAGSSLSPDQLGSVQSSSDQEGLPSKRLRRVACSCPNCRDGEGRYARKHAPTHAHTRAPTHVCTQTHPPPTHTHMHTRAHRHTCAHRLTPPPPTHTRMHAHTPTRTHTHTHTHGVSDCLTAVCVLGTVGTPRRRSSTCVTWRAVERCTARRPT